MYRAYNNQVKLNVQRYLLFVFEYSLET